MQFIADLFKPLLTLLVTAFGLAFIGSVLSPDLDAWIDHRIPVWQALEPAEEPVRGWLGIHEEVEPSWWHFWGRED